MLTDELYAFRAANSDTCEYIDPSTVNSIINGQYSTSLMSAIVRGVLQTVKQLISLGANVNAFDRDGHTPLMMASILNWLEVVQLLIESGAELNACTSRGESALLLAAWGGHAQVVQELLEKGANLHLTDECGRPPISLAAKGGFTNCIQLLVQHGASILNCGQGDSILHCAVTSGRIDLLEKFVAMGVPIDHPNDQGQTALHACIIHRSGDSGRIAQKLVALGANVHATDCRGYTPLVGAVIKEQMDVIELLIQHGSSTDLPAFDDAMVTAVTQCSTNCVRKLIELGANVNARNAKDGTLLESAVKFERLDMIELLVQHGADLELPGSNGMVPIIVAVKYGGACLKTLIKLKANVNARCDDKSVLDLAIIRSNPEMVETLILAGAELYRQPNKYRTNPLLLATDKANTKVLETILKYWPVTDLEDFKQASRRAEAKGLTEAKLALARHLTITINPNATMFVLITHDGLEVHPV